MNCNYRIISMASAVAMASALAGCATWNADPSAQQQQGPGAAYSAPYGAYPAQTVGTVEYGRVTNVSLVSAGGRPGNAAAGTALGAVAGGLLGNQIGHGAGRAAAPGLTRCLVHATENSNSRSPPLPGGAHPAPSAA